MTLAQTLAILALLFMVRADIASLHEDKLRAIALSVRWNFIGYVLLIIAAVLGIRG